MTASRPSAPSSSGRRPRWVGNTVESLCGRSHLDGTLSRVFASLARDVTRKPAPNAGVQRFGESGPGFVCRFGVSTRRYCELMYLGNGRILAALRAAGTAISFPGRDARMIGAG